MVATRAQRAQTKDEPAAPKRNALAAPARRGKKPEGDKPGSTAQKPTRAAATAKRAAAKPAAPTAAKQPAPTTRRTRAKEAEAPAPKVTLEDPESADELEVVEEPAAPAPAKATRKTATAKAAPKQTAAATATTTTTASRKRSAREIEPEPARPAKRQTRSRVTEDPQEREQDESMEAESKKAVAAPRATRATRGTKASQSRSAATVKPLAQRITVTAKKPTRKAKAEVLEPAVVEVEMEDAEEEAQAPEPAKSTRKSSRRAASGEPQDPASDAPVEPTPAKSTRKSSRRKTLEEAPEVPAEAAETEKEDPAPATPVKSTKKVSQKSVEEQAEAEKLDEEPAVEEQEPASTPVRTPEAPQQPETPVKPTPAPPKSILKSVRPEAKENVPPKTPGPAHYAATFPFAQEATPFFRPEIAPQAASFQARTPGFTKSLLHETPRKAPIASPFKLPPMSAAKHVVEANAGSVLNSPAKRAPLGAPIHGMTPMRPTAAKPEIKTSLLQTPAKKGLMLPPSTAPVNKQGPQPAHAKSSLLQTCPRKIALPGLPPKSSMASPTKADEGAMGSSLLSATPRKVRIEPPTQPAFGTSVQDFAIQAQNSALAVEPRRWNTPARTPAKRFATPGKTPAKSLVDADAGSPTPVKRTPAGLKDVNSALKLLNEASPAMPPATPTEQFVQTVIDKIDQSMSESESSAQDEAAYSSQDIEVARSADDEPASDDYYHDDIAADLELGQRPADAGEVEPCVSPADLVMSDSETPLGSPRAVPVEDVVMEEQVDVSMQDPVTPVQEVVVEVEEEAVEALQDVPEMVPIAEEPSAVAHHEEYVEATPARSEIQFIEDVHEVEVEAEAEQQPEIKPVEAAPEAVQMDEEQIKQQVEEFVEEHFEQPVEQPIEQPVEQPVEQPTEQTVEEHFVLQVEPQVEPQVEYVEEKFEETTIVEQTTSVQEEIVEEIPAVTAPQIPERPSTPTMEEQHAAALAKEKAKTERRDRRKRLSMAIELESSVRKPRKSLAFIPSLTPAKSALRSPFKKPFGSPKKSVAWATEPTQARIIEEPQQPQTPKVVHHAADTDVNIPRPDDGLLNGTVFFVDVRTADGDDAGDLFIPLLEEMGAKIVSDWDSNISHVLFKDGDSETLEKVFATNGAVKAVNIGWVLDCERFNKWVAEDEYLVEVSRLLGGSPARNLFAPSVANTPARATPAKSAFGTPFALMSLTPKGKPTLSPFADITPKPSTPIADAEDKENTPPTQLFKTPTKPSTPAVTVAGAAGEFSPSTPYYLHPENIIQKTCPPKQINKGLFDRDERQATAVTPFRQKMLLARRSLSPAAFGRAQGF